MYNHRPKALIYLCMHSLILDIEGRKWWKVWADEAKELFYPSKKIELYLQ